MPANQSKSDFVPHQQFVQLLPELDILDRLPRSPFLALPAISLPAWKPFGATLCHVCAIGYDFDIGPGFQCQEPRDDSLKLHLIVRGQWQTTREFFFGPRCGMAKNAAPTPRPRIPLARAVRKKSHKREYDRVVGFVRHKTLQRKAEKWGTRLSSNRPVTSHLTFHGRQFARDSGHKARLRQQHGLLERYG